MITIIKNLSGKYFSSNIPDVEFSISGVKAGVQMSVDGSEEIYNEILFPVDSKITLSDLTDLLTPYARQGLIITLDIKISEMDDADNIIFSSEVTASVIYCRADFQTGNVQVNVSDFCDNHFLSVLLGPKISAPGRLEFLHYLSKDDASVLADYSDGTTATFVPPAVQGNDKYTTIDVSPSRFLSAGKTLVRFTAIAGNRKQEFDMDPEQPDAAPILLFVNSFGVEELLYCTGRHQVSPSYTRTTAVVNGNLKNIKIEEKRKFSADTGYLNVAMQNWADELFRSDYVRLVNIYNGVPQVGKEITLSDSKSEISNDDSAMSKFTFDYQYSQSNHNVVDINRSGRVFDNTFDNTFD
ncbi:MAG: hypothetical protein LKE54_04450 [Prevotella sp.]|jgi:hypothetical protein|nr:hypothetical protein [Prevotella sp.]MCH3994293.1 hypothetical protein [Prevotella sp.]